MEVSNKYIVIKHHFEDAPKESDFEIKTETLDLSVEEGSDDMIVKNLYISINPFQINRMKSFSASQDVISYSTRITPGRAIDGPGIGKVVASGNNKFVKGDLVLGVFTWAEYCLVKERTIMRKLEPSEFPLTYHLGVLEMIKNNESMKAFKRERKATVAQNVSAKPAGEGSSQVSSKPLVPSSPGPRRMIPTPRVYLVDHSQTSAGTSSPSATPPPKRPRTVEPFSLDAPDFDAVGFVDQHIASYGVMPTDDVSILYHLDFITRSGIKLAHMGAALYWTAQDLPIHATKAFIEEAKSEFDRIKGLKEELEVKVTKLEKELEGEKTRAIGLAAAVQLAEDTALKHKDSYVTTYREMMDLRNSLESVRADYT
ncbi:uncharacterized protein LOC107465161 isoform X3 [Arachis duranensis]|nr:uncharacterized protein LOC107465161 isoform X3 [Arachis duranensis]